VHLLVARRREWVKAAGLVEEALRHERVPRLMLFDEPFAGVDPINVGDLQKQISHLRERGLGILITDHNVHDTLRICDRAYILAGSAPRAGDAEEIARSPRARAIYLGENFHFDPTARAP
jgi:ABC-type lipopolysaccharide export system ATPase subunit